MPKIAEECVGACPWCGWWHDLCLTAQDVANKLYDCRNRLTEQRDVLLAAVQAWDASLSDYCDGPLRDAVRTAIAACPAAVEERHAES